MVNMLSIKSQPFSYLSHLECSLCQHRYDPYQIQTTCLDCNQPLAARYDLTAVKQRVNRDQLMQRHKGMWRWHEILPVLDAAFALTLGEGDTPLLILERLGAASGRVNLFLKDEGGNPTGSFKARGLAAAVSKAWELGIEKLIIPTAGNAGGALAAYAARAGMPCLVLMPSDTPLPFQRECVLYGAQLTLVNGLINEAGRQAGELARREGWFDVSTFKEPYRLEGKKVMGYEIAQQFNWKLPDVIIYPTGGGTGLVGIWKAIAELAELGWLETDRRPRMIAVQAEGCAPVVKAFESGAETCSLFENASTYASGLRVPKPFADRLILSTLRESKGLAISVSEEEIHSAQSSLAVTEGIFAAPEGAATYAGLLKLQTEGLIQSDERILLLNTGHGLKYV
jgi:threonine synthase